MIEGKIVKKTDRVPLWGASPDGFCSGAVNAGYRAWDR